MEVPDVLVVTKADLGASGHAAPSTTCAPRSARSAPATRPVLAVSSLRPTTGIDALADALDAHRAGLDLDATRTRVRRLGALADFLHEHGERGLPALGGRRAARRWLEEQDPALDEPALLAPRERDGIGVTTTAHRGAGAAFGLTPHEHRLRAPVARSDSRAALS